MSAVFRDRTLVVWKKSTIDLDLHQTTQAVAKVHRVMTQNTMLFVATTMRTSNSAYFIIVSNVEHGNEVMM
jgi:hypothetical protein